MAKSILYITPFGTMSKGGQVSLYHIIEGIDGDKYRPQLIVPEEGEFAERVRRIGYKVHIRGFGSVKPRRLSKIIKDIRWLRSLIKSEGIHLVHTDHPKDTFHSIFATLYTGVPIVWHVRVSRPNRPLDLFNKYFVRKIIGVAGVVGRRFISPFWKGKKFTALYNGVDLQLYNQDQLHINELRRELIGDKDLKVVTTVVELLPEKGVYEFVDAARKSFTRNNNLKFIIVGEGRELGNLKAYIDELGIRDKVNLLGYRTNVPDILRASDIVVLASHSEGCPRAVLESMAAGKPIVGTDIPSIREIVTEDIGILFPLGDSDALSEAILEIVSDREKEQQMGAASRRMAEEKFDIKYNIAGVQKIYAELGIT